MSEKSDKYLIFKRFRKPSRGEKKIQESFGKNLYDLYYANSRSLVIVTCLILFCYQFILSENVFFCVFLYIFFNFTIKFCRIFKRLPNALERFRYVNSDKISLRRGLIMLILSSDIFLFTSQDVSQKKQKILLQNHTKKKKKNIKKM